MTGSKCEKGIVKEIFSNVRYVPIDFYIMSFVGLISSNLILLIGGKQLVGTDEG